VYRGRKIFAIGSHPDAFWLWGFLQLWMNLLLETIIFWGANKIINYISNDWSDLVNYLTTSLRYWFRNNAAQEPVNWQHIFKSRIYLENLRDDTEIEIVFQIVCLQNYVLIENCRSNFCRWRASFVKAQNLFKQNKNLLNSNVCRQYWHCKALKSLGDIDCRIKRYSKCLSQCK
jgi:hypothetical protein